METPEVGPEYMGSAGGLFFCISEIGGFTSPLAVGALVDWTGGFAAGGYFVISLCAAVFMLSFLVRTSDDREEMQG
jgi:nitrate/nitrite transporter NarK